MSSVKVSLDDDGDAFTLTGNIGSITDNGRAWSNFSNTLQARKDGDCIVIPFQSAEAENVYKYITKLFDKFDIPHENSEKVAAQQNRYLQEAENFNTFSKKAKDIRNNSCDPVEFQKFTDLVRNRLKSRTLRDHQLLSAYHLAFSQHACNFSVPGAGKTSVVYAAFSYLNSLPKDDPKHVDNILIVGPLSCFKAWEDEYKECFGETCDSQRLSGNVDPTEKQTYFYKSKQSLVTLIHYQSLSNKVEEVKHFLTSHKAMIVIDEAHKIKNMEGVWASAALEIAKHSAACARVVLTGTPIPNGYEDLYTLYKFIWPDKEVIGASPIRLRRFTEHAYIPSVKGQIDQVVDNISPFFIRIKKSDLHLPLPVEHEPMLVEMGPLQRQLYDMIESKLVPELMEDERDNEAVGVLRAARYMRLMQCATNPSLLLKPLVIQEDEDRFTTVSNDLDLKDSQLYAAIRDYAHKEVPSKFIAAKDLLTDILKNDGPEGKAIVWTIFLNTMDALKEYLEKHGIACEMLRGDVPTGDDAEAEAKGILTRERIIDLFHEEDSEFKVIIANPFAVGESISLHKACHNAIYLERNFNAAQFIQSKDRIHRVGLKEGDRINYHYLLSSGTIDQVIHDRLLMKEQRMLAVIESEEIPLIAENVGVDEESNDIKAIIRDYVARRG